MTNADHKRIDLGFAAARSVWPTPAQLQLLRAALWTGARARTAWMEWQHLENLRALDFSSWCLLPLAWRNLTMQGSAEDEILSECRGYYRYHWARNQQQLNRAAAWIDAWQQRGVPVVVLKGAALLADTYRDAGVRPMADIDLLVPREHVQKVAGWLKADGWKPRGHYLACEEIAPESEPAYNWQRGTEQLDLHWHVLHCSTRPEVTRRFWERTRPLQLGRTLTRQLAAEDLLLHVCLHGLHYSPQPPFRWLADAAWILRRAANADFEWARVIAMAECTGTLLPLRHGLEFAASELDLLVPREMLATLQRRRAAWREKVEYRRMVRADGAGRWVRAWHLARLTWRVGGAGWPMARGNRMRRFLCARWESPTLTHALGLALRKILTGYRGTARQRVEDSA